MCLSTQRRAARCHTHTCIHIHTHLPLTWNRYLNTTASSPIFRFGYGLSFSRFEYSNLAVHVASQGNLPSVNVSVTVLNLGTAPAAEVVQLYVTVPRRADVSVPFLALQGFEKIMMTPGVPQTVQFSLVPRQLCTVLNDGSCVATAGNYSISVGGHQPDDPLGAAASNSVTKSFDLPTPMVVRGPPSL